MTFDRSLPYDEHAEASVLAALMVDPNAAGKVQPVVSAADFYREHNGWTFDACMKLWERGEAIDQITVANMLERQGQLEDVGGLTYLSDLVLDLATPVGVEYWAAIVKRDAMYRRMIGAAVRIADLGYSATDDYERALAQAEQLVYELRAQRHDSTDFRHLSEFLQPYEGAKSQETPERPRALFNIRTGLVALDAVLGGLKPGQLIVVGAHTGHGKSALVNCIARNAAVLQNASVAVFTLEMTGEDLAMRMLAADARVPTRTIERGDTSEEQETRLGHALMVLSYADIHIDSTGGIRPSEVRQKCLKLAKEHGLDLVIIDHVQIMRADKPGRDRNAEVGSITGFLKAMALEFDLPIVLCSQLNRANDGSVPVLRDLRDSGSIEQDADVVLFIHRQEKYIKRDAWERSHSADEPYPDGHAYLIVAKQRNGTDGVIVPMRFRAPYTRFEDFDLPAAVPEQGAIPDFLRSASAVGYHA